jgi:hypothetical protein
MARPQVAEVRDGLQTWKAASNRPTMNKQSRSADKGWSFTLGFGQGTYESSGMLKNVTHDLRRGRIHVSGQEPVVSSSEQDNEPSGFI